MANKYSIAEGLEKLAADALLIEEDSIASILYATAIAIYSGQDDDLALVCYNHTRENFSNEEKYLEKV